MTTGSSRAKGRLQLATNAAISLLVLAMGACRGYSYLSFAMPSAAGGHVMRELNRRQKSDAQISYAFSQWCKSRGVTHIRLTSLSEEFAQEFLHALDGDSIQKVKMATGELANEFRDLVRSSGEIDWQWRQYHLDKTGFSVASEEPEELVQGFLAAYREGSLGAVPEMASHDMVKQIKSLGKKGQYNDWIAFCVERRLAKDPRRCPASLAKEFLSQRSDMDDSSWFEF